MNKEELFISWEKEFYDKYSNDPIFDLHEFQGIALGFFIAKGLNVDQALDMYEYCIEKDKF